MQLVRAVQAVAVQIDSPRDRERQEGGRFLIIVLKSHNLVGVASGSNNNNVAPFDDIGFNENTKDSTIDRFVFVLCGIINNKTISSRGQTAVSISNSQRTRGESHLLLIGDPVTPELSIFFWFDSRNKLYCL